VNRILFAALTFVVLIGSVGCGRKEAEILPEIDKLSISLDVSRFDRDFDDLPQIGLPALREKYPYLFPEQYPDSVWLAKFNDTLQQQLRLEVAKAFPDFEKYQAGLELFYKHLRYYFPKVNIPHVITLTTDVDYENRVLLADSLLFIGLDNYLGPNHEFYGGLSKYIARDLQSDYLVGDVAETFATALVPYPKERSFIARMVYYGKLLYLKDKLLPLEPDSLKIRYSAAEWDWARANEGQIWRYFIERELLYSTDNQLDLRFLDPAPFSKFRLELDSESPGRIGRYVGWQIVRAYMSNHSDSLDQLLALSGEQLFQKSNYKPPQ
jgi:gliding motility-associated lipoprotein GldB